MGTCISHIPPPLSSLSLFRLCCHGKCCIKVRDWDYGLMRPGGWWWVGTDVSEETSSETAVPIWLPAVCLLFAYLVYSSILKMEAISIFETCGRPPGVTSQEQYRLHSHNLKSYATSHLRQCAVSQGYKKPNVYSIFQRLVEACMYNISTGVKSEVNGPLFVTFITSRPTKPLR
jgi:hypothetical protein